MQIWDILIECLHNQSDSVVFAFSHIVGTDILHKTVVGGPG